MVDFKIKTADDEPEDFDREGAARTREQFGIETLQDDEELIDQSTSLTLHDDLATGAKRRERDSAAAAAPSPAGESATGSGDTAPELDELLLVEVVTELPTETAVPTRRDRGDGGLDAPPVTPAETAVLEAELQGAADRDTVARLALRLARRHASSAALFVVNQGVIAGMRGEGGEIEQRIGGVIISSNVESLFATVVETGRAVFTAAPYDGMNARLMSALGRRESRGVLVAPVLIRDRVVNLLYADNGPHVLPKTSIAALRTLCTCIAQAYERLILERKRG